LFSGRQRQCRLLRVVARRFPSPWFRHITSGDIRQVDEMFKYLLHNSLSELSLRASIDVTSDHFLISRNHTAIRLYRHPAFKELTLSE
jgi:hypothetical protein